MCQSGQKRINQMVLDTLRQQQQWMIQMDQELHAMAKGWQEKFLVSLDSLQKVFQVINHSMGHTWIHTT